MKQLNIQFNEEQYKRLVKRAISKKTSPYQYSKRLILESLESREYQQKMTFLYGYILYSLAAATVILVLL